MSQRFRCEQCGRRVKGRPQVSALGRKLCRSCSDNVFGAALGGMLGASEGSGLAGQLGYATVFQKVMRFKREKQQRQASRARAGEPRPADPSTISDS